MCGFTCGLTALVSKSARGARNLAQELHQLWGEPGRLRVTVDCGQVPRQRGGPQQGAPDHQADDREGLQSVARLQNDKLVGPCSDLSKEEDRQPDQA